MVKVLVADDDPLTRAGIEILLNGAGVQVVASVDDGAAALDALATARPEMLVLDIQMPQRSGLDVLRTLRSRGDERPIVLLTGSISDRSAKEAMQLGVNGLVIKANAPRDLIQCLDAVRQGRRWLDQEVMQRAVDAAMQPEKQKDPFEALSGRERAVAGLAQKGLRNQEIAAELRLTEGTVKVHLHNIYEKLNIRGRTGLILLAQESGT